MKRSIPCLISLFSLATLCTYAQPFDRERTDTLSQRQLESVVVTGQYEPQSVRKSVFRVRTIDKKDITARASTTVENILNTQLGIRFSNDMALGESDIELMGMTGQNVKVLIDGVPMIDRGASKQSLSQIDVNIIDRIEIVEGPMSVVYGTDALAGVVNIITNQVQGGDHLSVSARLQEESAGQEYSMLRNEGTHNGNLHIQWQKGPWQTSVSGTRNNFGGWQGSSAGRELDWKPKKQLLLSGMLGYRRGINHTWYRFDYLDEDIYTPGALNEANLKAVDKNYLTSRYTHTLQSNWKLNARFRVSASASHQQYERATQTVHHDFKNHTSELTSGAGEQDIAAFNSTFFRGTLQYNPSPKVQLQPGIEFSSQTGTGQRIDGRPTIQDYAFFISSEIKPWEALTLRPGVRFIKNTVYEAPPVVPSLNAKIALSTSFDVRAAYARGFRSPALRELYFVFDDVNHTIYGNRDLKAEYSNSFNAYGTWYGNLSTDVPIRSTLGGFYNKFNNLIELGFDPNNTRINTYINIHRFRTVGATWENALHWRHLDANIGVSYIGRRFHLSESEQSDTYWSPEISSQLSYQIPAWNMGLNLFYKYTGKHIQFQMISNASGDLRISHARMSTFNQADISIQKKINRYVDLTGGVRNLFNVTNVKNASLTESGSAHNPNTGYVPVSYGRSFFLGLRFSWTKNY